MKEVNAGRDTCKNCLLKVKLKTRDEFTAVDIKENAFIKLKLFKHWFGESFNLCNILIFSSKLNCK
jgi:hypothetical protein